MITSTLDLVTPQQQRMAQPRFGSFPDGRQIDRWMQQQGRYSVVTYDGDVSGLSLKVKAALGAKAGLDVGRETTTKNVIDARYLSAPGDDGQRRVVPFTDCIDNAG